MTKLQSKKITLDEWWEWWNGINAHGLPNQTKQTSIAGRIVTGIMKTNQGYKVWFGKNIDPDIIEDGKRLVKIVY